MANPVPALISIHDVAPATITQVKALIDLIPANCRQDVLLLIIPGGEWRSEQLQQLKDWQQQGFMLAGHGWHHKAKTVKGWYHRWHSLLISRDAAEHLALNENEIAELITRNYRWFTNQGLNPPLVYVPPAWAMGSITRTRLRQLPFRYYEFTRGIFDAKENVFKRLPLVGFEADNRIRKLFLLVWNQINFAFSAKKRPVRISIHPQDNHLLLAKHLKHCLQSPIQSYCYRTLPI